MEKDGASRMAQWQRAGLIIRMSAVRIRVLLHLCICSLKNDGFVIVKRLHLRANSARETNRETIPVDLFLLASGVVVDELVTFGSVHTDPLYKMVLANIL